MIARAAGVALAGLVLTACGGSSGAARALEDTESKLREIRTGALSLVLLASSATAAAGEGAGFSVEGTFAVGEKKGALPLADLQYTRITGAERVRRAVADARAEVVTGRGDRFLRRADVSVELAVTDPRVRDALGDLAGARLTLTLEVKDRNQRVEVTVPQPQGGRR